MRQFILLLIFDKEKANLMAVKRAESDTAFGGMWSMPGGGVNEGETIDQAATRELVEETNLKIDQINPNPLIDLSLTIKNTPIQLVVKFASILPGNPKPNDKDIETIAWITPDKLIGSFKKFGVPAEALKKFQSKLALINNK